MIHLVLGLNLLAQANLSSAHQTEILTLSDALEIAVSQSPLVQAAEKDIAEADANLKISTAAILPQASLSGTASYQNSNTSFQFGANGTTTNTSMSLGVNQALDITGLLRDQIRAVRYQRDAIVHAKDVVVNDLRQNVRIAYYQALQASELVGVQTSNLDATIARLNDAEIRHKEGSIAEFDVIRFKTQVAQAQQALAQAEGNLITGKQSLNLAMGRQVHTEFGLPTTRSMPPQPSLVDDLVQFALETRPEVNQANSGIQALETLVQVAKKQVLPTLSFGANALKNFNPATGQPNSTLTAQAVITLPITIPGLVRANTKSAEEREAKAKIQLEQLQLGIAFEVRSAYTQYETALETHQAAREAQNLASEALRLAELRYREQVGIQLDVIVAQNDLVSAMANVVNTNYQVNVAYANLQRAVSADDLSGITPPTLNEFQKQHGVNTQSETN